MTQAAIPNWTAAGVLPAVNSTTLTSADRSPYRVSLADLVLRFCTTEERKKILDGFLRYRIALYAAGLTKGFQWVDGSFLEEIEVLQNRPPRDIDVVTFFDPPETANLVDLVANHKKLFNKNLVKDEYMVDSFYVQRAESDPAFLVQMAAYWCSVWSHQRESLAWKGYLQIELSPEDDIIAKTNLTKMVIEEVEP